MAINLKLSADFHLLSVQEDERANVPLAQLLHDVTAEDLAETATARDNRFVNQQTGNLRMSSHSLIVRSPRGIVLVDTCVGNDKTHHVIQDWHQQSWPYLERLDAAGLTPADVDFVCCTHFHADHVGWNTRLKDGGWVPTFPNARYLFAEPEYRFWEEVHSEPSGHPFGPAWQESVLPVIRAGMADIVQPDHEVLPGVSLRPAFGHSPGNVVIDVDSGKGRAVLSGDVLHHPVQIERPHWNSIYDQDRDAAQATREQLVAGIADTDIYLVGAHFAGPTALQVSESGGNFRFR